MRAARSTGATGALVAIILCSRAAVPNAPLAAQSAGQPTDYARDVRPIFRRHCYECHGPDRSRAELRLDRKDRALAGGVSGAVIKPGDSEHSRLVHRIAGLGDEPRMPRGRDPLDAADIAVIRAWIDQGAVWPDEVAADAPEFARHWA